MAFNLALVFKIRVKIMPLKCSIILVDLSIKSVVGQLVLQCQSPKLLK